MSSLKPVPVVFCAECGKPFHRTQPSKIYCSGECRQTVWNRRVSGGFKLYDAAMKWRIDRPQNALADLTAEADMLACEERIVRKKRDAKIQKELADHPGGILPPKYEPGKSVSENVRLAPISRNALINAAEFALAMSKGRTPNDPDKLPENWPKKKLQALADALATLSGKAEAEAC